MTKKDFQLIAQTLLTSAESTGLDDHAVRELANHFADALASTNPLFKRDLFIQAATGVVAVTARKAKPDQSPGLDYAARGHLLK